MGINFLITLVVLIICSWAKSIPYHVIIEQLTDSRAEDPLSFVEPDVLLVSLNVSLWGRVNTLGRNGVRIEVPSRNNSNLISPFFLNSLFLRDGEKNPYNLEYSMCGGRWHSEWDLKKGGQNSKIVRDIVDRQRQHVICSNAVFSACFKDALRSYNGVIESYNKILKYWGSVIGSSIGLGQHEHIHKEHSLNNYSLFYHLLADTFFKIINSVFGHGVVVNRGQFVPLHFKSYGFNDFVGDEPRDNGCFFTETRQEVLCSQHINTVLSILKMAASNGESYCTQSMVESESDSCVLNRIIDGVISSPMNTLLVSDYYSLDINVQREDLKDSMNHIVNGYVSMTFVLTGKTKIRSFLKQVHLNKKLQNANFMQQKKRYLDWMETTPVLGNLIQKKQTFDEKTTLSNDASHRCSLQNSLVQRGFDAILNISVRCPIDMFRNTGKAVVDVFLVIPSQSLILITESLKNDESSPLRGVVVGKSYNPSNANVAVSVRFNGTYHPQNELHGLISFKAQLPMIQMEHYAPNRDQDYIIPQAIGRFTFFNCSNCSGPIVKISHQDALESLLNSLSEKDEDLEKCNGVKDCLQYFVRMSAYDSIITILLPIADPGMLFNNIAISSVVFAGMTLSITPALSRILKSN